MLKLDQQRLTSEVAHAQCTHTRNPHRTLSVCPSAGDFPVTNAAELRAEKAAVPQPRTMAGYLG